VAARSERECADILACSGELDVAEAATDLVGAAAVAGGPPRYAVRALPATEDALTKDMSRCRQMDWRSLRVCTERSELPPSQNRR
jgi:hypothetical protein